MQPIAIDSDTFTLAALSYYRHGITSSYEIVYSSTDATAATPTLSAIASAQYDPAPGRQTTGPAAPGLLAGG